MDSLMIILAASMKAEEILQKLQDELNDYLANPSEEGKSHIAAVCALFLAHMKTGGSMEGAMEMLNDFKKFEDREKLFQTDKN